MLSHIGMEKEEVAILFNRLDLDGNNSLDLLEFAKWVMADNPADVDQQLRRLLGSSSTSSASTIKNIVFQPGELGLSVDAEHVVTEVGLQAEEHGVRVGWKLLSINDEPFDAAALRLHAGGKATYTFEARPRRRARKHT